MISCGSGAFSPQPEDWTIDLVTVNNKEGVQLASVIDICYIE